MSERAGHPAPPQPASDVDVHDIIIRAKRTQCCDPIIDGVLGSLIKECEDLRSRIAAMTAERDAARQDRNKLKYERGDWVPGAKCPKCNGHGEDDEARTCNECAGTGEVWLLWKERATRAEAELAALRSAPQCKEDEDAAYRDAAGNIDPFKFALKRSKLPYEEGRYQSCAAENDCEQDEGA